MVSEGSELSALVTEIADVTAGPEEGSIALAKRVYAHLYEGNLNSRWASMHTADAATLHGISCCLAADQAMNGIMLVLLLPIEKCSSTG